MRLPKFLTRPTLTRETAFWEWFTRYQAEFLSFDARQELLREKLFDRLATQMQKVNPDLCFEFGPPEPKREFVISAGGIRSAFASVVSLLEAAPDLPQWQIIAFRPRRGPINTLEFQGKRVDPNDVYFTLLDNGKTDGIQMFIPGFQEDDIRFKQIGYLLLDEALGEFDVETRLGSVQFFNKSTATPGDRICLTELPEIFDRLIFRLEGLSGKPS